MTTPSNAVETLPGTGGPSNGGPALAELYEKDETAWLDATSRLIREGQLSALDYENLASYLEDMAKRDRREVESRLRTLIAHVLKWVHQPSHQGKSWKVTILNERHELEGAFTRVLRRHAEVVLPKCYREAVKLAAAETGLPEETFPADCPYTLDWLLTEKLF